MSTNIDERVVGMKFDNATFEKNAGTTLSTLDKLKQKLNFSDVGDASKSFSLNGVGQSIDAISAKFAAMATVGITALANITNRAVNAGIQMVKSLAIDPINQGLQEYETGLTAIQTILANTKGKGEGIDSVNAALKTLNDYSDLTIYNFGQMTSAVKTLTTSGAGLGESVQVVKGFANAAALAGVGAQDMASALQYGVNQAISKGKMMTQDWMSLETAGIAGEGFKNAIIETARVQGVNVDAMIKKQGSFRDSLSEGWLTSKILEDTLAKFSGDMSDEQLKQLGYTKEQVKSIQDVAKTAVAAAQDVKTGSQLIDTLRESVGSGWAQTWQIVFGDLEQAKKLWSGLNNAISPVIGAMSDARNNTLKRIFDGWRDMGGVDDLLNIITNTIKIFTNVIKPLKDAFASVFPPSGVNGLKIITGALSTLTGWIVSATSNLSFFKAIFQTVFSVVKMAGSIVFGVVGALAALVKQLVTWVAQLPFIHKIGQAFSQVGDFVSRMAGYFDRLTAGDVQGFITGLSTSLTSFSTVGGKASDTIQKMQAGLASAQVWLANFKTGLGGIISMVKDGDFLGASKTFGWEEDSKAVDFFLNLHDAIVKVVDSFRIFGTSANNEVTAKADAAVSSWQSFLNMAKGIGDFLKPGIDNISAFFGEVAAKIKAFFDKATFQDILALVNTGLFMGFYMAARSFFVNFSKLFENVGGTFKSISKVFDGLTGSLKGMQQNLQAKALLEIAGAVAILAASVALITLLDQDKIWVAISAIGALIGSLVGSMVALDKWASNNGVVKVSIAITLMANALLIMAGAVAIFGNMDAGTLSQGLLTIASTLAMLVAVAMGLGKVEGNILSASAAILIMSVALTAFAGVIALFALFNWNTVAEGLGYMAATLGVLAGAFILLDKVKTSMIEGAAAMVIVGFAMTVLAGAIAAFSALSGGNAMQAILTMAAALLVLVPALWLMEGTIGAAAALLVVSIGLIALAAGLKALASMGWKTVLEGLGLMAAVFIVLAAAGYFLSPALLALGIAMTFLGAGMLMAGAGFALFATGIATLAALGGAGVAAITAIIIGLAQTIPLIAQQIGLGIKAFALVIANAGPELVAALTTLLLSLLTAIDNIIPQLFVTLGNLIDQFVWFLEGRSEQIFQAGFALLMYVLNGINNNIGKVIDVAGSIIVNFINGMDRNLQKIIDAGGNLIINFISGFGRKQGEIMNAAIQTVSTFIDGIDNAVYTLSYKITSAGRNIAFAIINGVVDGLGLGSALARVKSAITSLADKLPDWMKTVLGIHSPSRVMAEEVGAPTAQGVAVGIISMYKTVRSAAEGVGETAITALKSTMANVSDIVSNDIDMTPQITPVIDLTNVEKSASLITGMLTPPPLSVDTSIGAVNDANAVVQAKAAVEAANAEATASNGDTYLKFEQTNNSPVALSEIEIYRQTKNLISTAKGALDNANAG